MTGTRALPLCLALACTDAGTDKPEDTSGGTETGDTSAEEAWSPIGLGDGTPESVTFTYVLGPEEDLDDPRDLGFDADGNLWVANRQDDRTFVIFDPGTEEQSYDRLKDGYAMHFMEETAAFSFDGDVQMGSCGESRNTYNDRGDPNDYMGPVLWSTDLNIFGVEDPIGLGSHLDMSHESPLCVGIAWEVDNVYWLFDGLHGSLTRNDFQADHGVGMDEHYDSIVRRLSEPEVSRVEEAPSHLIIDHTTNLLYAADTGNNRVLWLDITSGEEGRRLAPNDPGVEHTEWDGATWGELATGLDNPGGLAFDGAHLYVGEWGTGVIHQLTLEGETVRTLDTGFGAQRLYGIEIGPDGHLWVIDVGSGVYRIDP